MRGYIHHFVLTARVLVSVLHVQQPSHFTFVFGIPDKLFALCGDVLTIQLAAMVVALKNRVGTGPKRFVIVLPTAK